MQHSWGRIATFVVLAFLLSWGLGPFVLLVGQALLPPPVAQHADVVVAFGPALAAAVTLGLTGEPEERRSFRASLLRVRINPAWYAAAVLVPAGVAAAIGLGAGLFSADADALRGGGSTFAQVGAVSLFLGGGFGEEPGWRGYLFPRLAEARGFLVAVLAVGAVWSLWHVPMYLLGGGFGIPPGPIVLMSLAGSVLLGWGYERTGRSVPACALFHAAVNAGATTLAVPAPDALRPTLLWAYSVAYGILAVVLLGWLRVSGEADVASLTGTGDRATL